MQRWLTFAVFLLAFGATVWWLLPSGHRAPARTEPTAVADDLGTEPPAVEDEESDAAPDFPREGESEVEIAADGRVTVRSNGAYRREVLALLARRGDFQVEDRTRRNPVVHVDVVRSGLAQALAAVLAGVPYTVHYRAEGVGSPDEIALVEVGIDRVAATERSDAARGGELVKDEDAALRAELLAKGEEIEEEPVVWRARRILTPEEQRAWEEGARMRETARHEALREGVRAESMETRLESVYGLEADDPEDLPHILEALGDPEPSVRAEAAYQLRWGEADNVIDSISAALQDPAPKVLVAAIGSAGFLREAALASDVAALADHDDPAVRRAVQENLSSLR